MNPVSCHSDTSQYERVATWCSVTWRATLRPLAEAEWAGGSSNHVVWRRPYRRDCNERERRLVSTSAEPAQIGYPVISVCRLFPVRTRHWIPITLLFVLQEMIHSLSVWVCSLPETSASKEVVMSPHVIPCHCISAHSIINCRYISFEVVIAATVRWRRVVW
jgi:hypothetical protein